MDAWRHHFQHSAFLDPSHFNGRHLARDRRRTQHICSTRAQLVGDFRPFTLCELDRALRNNTAGKSPGCDNIPDEALNVDLG